MAHNIDMSNGRANLAFVGATPWHELGVEMPGDADLNEWRKQAGLDFIAKKSPVRFTIEDDVNGAGMRSFNDKAVIYRDDTGAPLGIISDKHYRIVQPAEIIEFFREFAKAGDMKLEVAGSILGGRRIWALAALDMPIRIKGNDVVRPFFNLTTSFDGETGTLGAFTTTRVVCNNTLNIFYHELDADGMRKGYGQSGFAIPHRSQFNPEVAKEHVRKLAAAAAQFEEDANIMSDRLITGEEAMQFFVGMVGVKDKDDKDLTRASRAKIERLLELYKTGPGAGLRAAENTMWGALNAVTRYIDHEAKQRSTGGRLASAWFGAGKELKAKAFKAALAVSKGEDLAVAA